MKKMSVLKKTMAFVISSALVIQGAVAFAAPGKTRVTYNFNNLTDEDTLPVQKSGATAGMTLSLYTDENHLGENGKCVRLSGRTAWEYIRISDAFSQFGVKAGDTYKVTYYVNVPDTELNAGFSGAYFNATIALNTSNWKTNISTQETPVLALKGSGWHKVQNEFTVESTPVANTLSIKMAQGTGADAAYNIAALPEYLIDDITIEKEFTANPPVTLGSYKNSFGTNKISSTYYGTNAGTRSMISMDTTVYNDDSVDVKSLKISPMSYTPTDGEPTALAVRLLTVFNSLDLKTGDVCNISLMAKCGENETGKLFYKVYNAKNVVLSGLSDVVELSPTEWKPITLSYTVGEEDVPDRITLQQDLSETGAAILQTVYIDSLTITVNAAADAYNELLPVCNFLEADNNGAITENAAPALENSFFGKVDFYNTLLESKAVKAYFAIYKDGALKDIVCEEKTVAPMESRTAEPETISTPLNITDLSDGTYTVKAFVWTGDDMVPITLVTGLTE